MTPELVLDKDILEALEYERARIESRFNIPSDACVDPLSLFKDFDDSIDIPNAVQTNKILLLDKPSRLNDLLDYTGCSECSNSILYTPKSILDWHTNSNSKGLRCYLSYSYGDSVFRYVDESGEIVDSHDLPNTWQIRRFTIPDDDLLWHTVACSGARITYGFKNGSHG